MQYVLAIKCYIPWTLLARSLCALVDVLLLTLHPSTTKYFPWTLPIIHDLPAVSSSTQLPFLFLTSLVQVDLWIPIRPFLYSVVFLFKFTYNKIHFFVVQFCEFWQMLRVMELLSHSRYRTISSPPPKKNLSSYCFLNNFLSIHSISTCTV